MYIFDLTSKEQSELQTKYNDWLVWRKELVREKMKRMIRVGFEPTHLFDTGPEPAALVHSAI